MLDNINNSDIFSNMLLYQNNLKWYEFFVMFQPWKLWYIYINISASLTAPLSYSHFFKVAYLKEFFYSVVVGMEQFLNIKIIK